MTKFINITLYDEKKNLKQGHEYRILQNAFGYKEIGCLTRFRDGRLNDDGENPAVEFQDGHMEYFHNGFLHNSDTNEEGKLQPAIIANCGKNVEYWFNGKQVNQDKKPLD
jgi:hypothetical protein